MLQQLSAASGAQVWAIASMFLFLGVFITVSAWVLTRRAGHYDVQARLPLDDGVPTCAPPGAASSAADGAERGR